jgi:hypothetical protein
MFQPVTNEAQRQELERYREQLSNKLASDEVSADDVVDLATEIASINAQLWKPYGG